MNTEQIREEIAHYGYMLEGTRIRLHTGNLGGLDPAKSRCDTEWITREI